MRIRALDFILWPVTDLARAARFYRETLGLRQEMLNEEYQWAEFDCGNTTLALKGAAKPSEVAGGARLALAVDDARAACEQLRAAGVRVVTEPVDYGVCRCAEVADPDGNIVLLHQRADGTAG